MGVNVCGLEREMRNDVADLRLVRARKVSKKDSLPTQWHRRLALQLATQLPENQNDAEIVLDLTRQLVVDFLNGDRPPAPSEPGEGRPA